MIVHLYAICWNEISMLGFFFRHYEGLVDRFVMFDDGSTDGTLEYLRAKPNVEVHPFPYSHPDSFVLSQQELQNQCWKESRGVADWVVVTAIDEHVYHPRLKHYLASCKRRDVTYLPALGFEMVTEDFPAPHKYLARTRMLGVPAGQYSKLRVFDPNAIEESRFAIGGHGAKIEGKRMLPDRDELLLLHYKNLGVDYVRERHRALNERLRSVDRKMNWGFQYSETSEVYSERHRELLAKRIDLSDPNYLPWRDHSEVRWWRPAPAGESVAPMSPLKRLLHALRPPYFE